MLPTATVPPVPQQQQLHTAEGRYICTSVYPVVPSTAVPGCDIYWYSVVPTAVVQAVIMSAIGVYQVIEHLYTAVLCVI